MTSKVIQGNIRPLLFQNPSSTISYEPNIMKAQYRTSISLLFYRDVLWFFLLRPSDLITTLTYVLMDNFFPYYTGNKQDA